MHFASLFNPKAKKWVLGRKKILQRIENVVKDSDNIIWFHCASLGEFEQGRPVIERIRELFPRYKVFLTFFSPSGYDSQKNYHGADWVFYLPLDGPVTAKRFLEIVNPVLVVFVKYEFWYYYLKKIKYRNIPIFLISALFRKDMSFFKWYGGIVRKMLSRFTHLFVQNESSKKLLDEIGLEEIVSISGDTRFDRVVEIAEKSQVVPGIEKFIDNNHVIVAGSTWPDDENALQRVFMKQNSGTLKLIIAPHEIDEKHLSDIDIIFPGCIRFSSLSNSQKCNDAKVLVIDNIGLLSRLYKYATIAYVGGGFTKSGVHNVLEAAVYGVPVLMGPNYQRYSEAVALVGSGGGFSFQTEIDLTEKINILLTNDTSRKKAGDASLAYVKSEQGATRKIIDYIQENRLLTN